MATSLKSSIAAVGLISLFCWGCSHAAGRPVDPGKPIVIRILSEGAPVQEGSIDLDGMGGGADLTSTGEATFAHVPYGTYRVVVIPKLEEMNLIPPGSPDEASRSASKPLKNGIPKKFRDESTTPLQIEALPGESADRFEFDLKK